MKADLPRSVTQYSTDITECKSAACVINRQLQHVQFSLHAPSHVIKHLLHVWFVCTLQLSTCSWWLPDKFRSQWNWNNPNFTCVCMILQRFFCLPDIMLLKIKTKNGMQKMILLDRSKMLIWSLLCEFASLFHPTVHSKYLHSSLETKCIYRIEIFDWSESPTKHFSHYSQLMLST